MIQSLESKSTKSEDIVQTSDEDEFGEFQHWLMMFDHIYLVGIYLNLKE